MKTSVKKKKKKTSVEQLSKGYTDKQVPCTYNSETNKQTTK